MADPLRAAHVQRLADGPGAVALTGVARARQVVAARVLERLYVIACGVPSLRTGEIKRDHSVAAIVDRRTGQLIGDRRRERAEAAHDDPGDGAGLPLPALDAGERRLHGLGQ